MASASNGGNGVVAPRRPGRVGLVLVTVAVSGMLIAAGLVALLSQSAVRPTGMNRARVTAELGALGAGQTLCQRAELVPAGTGAIAPSLLAPAEGGAAVRVAVIAGGETVAGGALPAGWHRTPTIPLGSVLAHDTPARVCIATAGGGPVGLGGEAAAQGRGHASIGARAIGGDLRLVYLPPHAESWWGSLATVAGRMSVGHPLGGTAIALLVALLSAACAALVAWQLTREDP